MKKYLFLLLLLSVTAGIAILVLKKLLQSLFHFNAGIRLAVLISLRDKPFGLV